MFTDLTGRDLGPFHVEARLGAGAMGTVYRARHRKTGKKAAIKVMSVPGDRPNPTLAARFEREIKILSQFHHANIVRIYGSSEQDGIRYYAMELVDGESLQDILDHKEKLSFQRTIAYCIQICEALQELHSVGVIHRDLKPANIMVTSDHRVKLTDFGIAKDLSRAHTAQLTQADHTVGTVAYMSPEQLTGQELTRKSDLYALGIVLYRMLTGRLPFTGETMFEYMNQRMNGAFPLPSLVDRNVPLEFDDLIRDMLAQDPQHRPLDAYVVMQRLLDISKKAKEGTLLRTRPNTSEALAETAEIPGRLGTVLRSVTSLVSFGSGTRKRKRKKSAERASVFESAWFLALVLAVILGASIYFLWPPGPEARFARGKELASSGNVIDMERALKEYFEPILAKDPESPFRDEIEDIRVKYLTEKARGRARMQIIRGIHSDASEAERQYVQALMIEKTFGDRLKAEERFRAIIQLFKDKPDEIGWVKLAEEQLRDTVRFENEEQRVAAKRQGIERAFAEAEKLLAEGKKVEALQIYQSVKSLYAGDEEVKDLVEKAAAKLQ